MGPVTIERTLAAVAVVGAQGVTKATRAVVERQEGVMRAVEEGRWRGRPLGRRLLEGRWVEHHHQPRPAKIKGFTVKPTKRA